MTLLLGVSGVQLGVEFLDQRAGVVGGGWDVFEDEGHVCARNCERLEKVVRPADERLAIR